MLSSMISGKIGPMAAAMLALALLAGCGGGSSESDASAGAETTTPAPPKDYGLEQLIRALPGVEEIPGADEVYATCPEDNDKKECEPYDKGTAVVLGSIAAADPVGAEQVQNQATPKDFVAVQGQRYPDEAAPAKVTKASAGDRKYVGTFAIDSEDDGTVTRGKGAIDDLTIDQWTGLIAHRNEVSSESKTDKGLLVASVRVSSGRTTVVAFVSISAAGRDPRAAIELGEGLVRDYIERLG